MPSRLHFDLIFRTLDAMSDASQWKIAKWPFAAGFVVLNAVAWAVIMKSAHPVSGTVMLIAAACVALGAWLGCLPFILEYRAINKLIDANALTTVAEQLQDLKKYSAQVSGATAQWAQVQEATKGDADKTVTAAREIAERMTEEIREFNEFQVKLNDTEKGALRLEVEKLRRTEGEWLQVVVRILDHVFALYTAALRSGQPELAEQIGNFQNACRDAARRVGLTPFIATPGEPFDGQKFRAHGVENPPADAVVAELLAPGLSFQGRLIRPALVRLQDATASAAAPEEAAPETPPASDDLTLEAD